MGNCVTGSSRSQYTNENFLFMMCIFDNHEPLKKRFIDTCMVVYFCLSWQRYGHNNWLLVFLKACDNELYYDSMDDKNFPSFCVVLLFRYFPYALFYGKQHGVISTRAKAKFPTSGVQRSRVCIRGVNFWGFFYQNTPMMEWGVPCTNFTELVGQLCLSVLPKKVIQFLCEIKWTIANRRKRSEKYIDKGKCKMLFEVYCLMCTLLVCGSHDEYIFVQCFLSPK